MSLEDGTLINISGGRRWVRSHGCGPSIVLIMGGGIAGVGGWDSIEPGLAAFARVTTYDRAGLGHSDPATIAPTAADLAFELHEVLTQVGLSPPHLLVGASLGGLVALMYTAQYPADVGALVLLDPTRSDEQTESPQHTDALIAQEKRAAAGEFRTPQGKTELAGFFGSALGRPVNPAAARFVLANFEKPEGWAALRRETERRAESRRQVREAIATGRMPDVPVLVMSAGIHPIFPGSEAAIAEHHAAHARLAATFRRGRHVIATDSSHWITIDTPQRVVDEVRALTEVV